MKKSEKQLRAFIREALDHVIKQPNLVKRSLPHTYQHWYTKNAPNRRKLPEDYLSAEQKEKYDEKLAVLRAEDGKQTDALVEPLINEPPGFYDKSKGYTDEMEMIARIHDEEVPNPDGPGTVDRNFDDRIPPFMLNLRGYTNNQVYNLFRAAENIWIKTTNERMESMPAGSDVGFFGQDLADRTRLYKYINNFVLERDIIKAADNLEKYLSDAKYEEDRQDLASFEGGRGVLKMIRPAIKSLKDQYADTMKYYHTGEMPVGYSDNMYYGDK